MGDVAKYSGSTAVACVVWFDEKTQSSTVYSANLGDSRAILVYACSRALCGELS